MMVYVNGQDIARLVLGGLRDGVWVSGPEVLEIRPEGYLAGFQAFLERTKLDRSDIQGFVLVQGPGSATALRTAHAMVNALAFGLKVQVVALEKAPDAPDEEIVTQLAEHAAHPFALPSYAHAPNITATNRDALKRKAT